VIDAEDAHPVELTLPRPTSKEELRK
jgi:hypothetical protein